MSEMGQSEARGRWGRGSLRFRLTALAVLTVLVGLSLGMAVDYRRESRIHRTELFSDLRHEANALLFAWQRIPDRGVFVGYVHAYCDQMDARLAPGHHVLVVDAQGEVIARRGHVPGVDIEQFLLQEQHGESILHLQDHDVAQYRVHAADGTTIIVAQYLDYIQGVLRAQLVDRVLTALGITLGLMGALFLAMHRWVLLPLGRLGSAARAWGARNFRARSEPSGSADLRELANEFNRMAVELEHHEDESAAELERARTIQSNLLPTRPPALKGLTVAAAYRPAKVVAGDLYDVFDLPDGRTAVAILDVAGHGLSSALLTGVVKMSLHWRMAEIADLGKAVAQVNQDLLDCATEGQFVTATVGVWDARDRTWRYCAAGMSGGLLIQDGKQELLPSTGALIGVFEKEEWAERTVTLRPGDRLVLYTDGVTDAGMPADALDETGLASLLDETRTLPLRDQIEKVIEAASQRCAKAPCDDVTIVALEAQPDGRPGQYIVL